MRILLRSNVRGLTEPLELTEKTLIVGASASGKTRIQNAIELALTGTVSDLGGKALIKSDALIHEFLAPEPDATLFSEVSITGVGTWRWSRARGSRAIFQGPPTAVVTTPLRDIADAFSGTDAKAQAYLLARCGLSRADVLSRLGEAADDYARLVIEGDTEEAKLKAALTTVNASIRRRMGDVETSRKLLDDLGGMPDATDISTLQEAADRAMAARIRAEQVIRARQRLTAARAERAGLRPAATPTLPPDAAQAVRAGRLLLRRAIDRRATTCPLCASPTTLATLEARDAALANRLVENDNARIAELDRAILKLESDAEGDDDVATAKDREDRAMAALVSARARQTAAYRIAEARRTLDEADSLIARDRRLVEAIERVISDATLGGVDAWRRQVQRYLPEHLTFTAKIDPVARFGLMRDGRFYPAPSGAERVQLQIAMAMADHRTGTTPLLIPEERAIDSKTLAAAMRWWADAPGILILASIVPPAGRTPKGWTILDLGA